MTEPNAAPLPNEPDPQNVYVRDLVGRVEIAARLGVSTSALDTWRRRYPDTFPTPVVVLSGTPVYEWPVFRDWAESTPRKVGRPRKESHG